ncbi:MAG: S-layer homology domain-containing protein [Ruminococcaceae bacterium]|nr:S-layer homology domain-containing protein [Oscillospiraceae bacterium]
MNKIKISALALSLALTFAPVAQAADFTDMPTDPRAVTAIENAVKNGLISGYAEDNTVRPDNNIKRSEMAVIISQACKVTKEGDISKFVDVSEDDWFYSAMAKAYEMGAFAGDDKNQMNPNNNITFQECFTVLSQVFDLIPKYQYYPRPNEIPADLPADKLAIEKRVYDISCLDAFADKDQIASWALPYVAGVVYRGGWDGIDGNLTPTDYITRAQFSIVMDNLIKNYIDEPGEYTAENFPKGTTMIRCNGVVLNDVETDSDIYVGDSVEAGHLTVNNINTTARFIVRGCTTPIKDPDTGVLTYGDEGLVVTGSINEYRVIRPYINSNISGATYDVFYSIPKTFTSLGRIN